MAALGNLARVNMYKMRNIAILAPRLNTMIIRTCTAPYSKYTIQPTMPAESHKLVEGHLRSLCDDIKQTLGTPLKSLQIASGYHFDGQGKAFRPMVVMLIAMAFNYHSQSQQSVLLGSQKRIAEIAEMIHVASLVHDDVIDASDTRRGKPSVMHTWGQRKAVLVGDYILSQASMALARIGNNQVVTILSQVLEDLVRGEFMQLGSKEDESERFNHYLKKTYKKTASLIANSCHAVALLGDCDEGTAQIAYEYGRNIGIAFQLVDDLLDFISTEEMMGKPTAADLKLGLATAPVLFAAQEFPELNAMIMRRFTEPGDVEFARHCVAESHGVSHTRALAESHAAEAVRQISLIRQSQERDSLIAITHKVLSRLK